MNEKIQKPGKGWAYVCVVVGLLLLLSGLAAVAGYLGLPFLFSGGDILTFQLGQIAAMFLGLVCGGFGIVHGIQSIRNRRSRSLRLPPHYAFWLLFALALGLGNLLLNFDVSTELLFPALFFLGAALPTLAVLAWASSRMNWPLTWRQGSLALVGGSTLSIIVTIFLSGFIPYLYYLLVQPLRYLAGSVVEVFSFGTSGMLERLFSSPLIIVFLIYTAVQAPIPEEIAKALSLPIFGRLRIKNERQAFAIGVFSGAGFAILENMLYEGVYAQWSGWTWGGVTLLRGFGSVMHPLCTGLVALGWFRVKEKGLGELVKAYFLAVGLHTLWNGGFEPFVFLTGLEQSGGMGETLSFYGEAINVLLVVFLIALSVGMWWFLGRVTANLAQEEAPRLAPVEVSPRTLAIWAFASALLIIPIGAALGQVWPYIRAALLGGG